jgi:ABC-type Na+ efflux pump permease subunit
MFWKERHAPRTRGVIRLLVGFVFVFGVAGIAYPTVLFGVPAFVELWQAGYSAGGAYGARIAFNVELRMVCTLLYVACCLGVASLAAAGVAGEREEDTWTSLITTPMDGEEILRAKMFGAVWGMRWCGLLLLVLWLVGLSSGAVHPAGFVAVAVETAVFVWFAAALGVSLSLSSRSSARAQTATMAILVTLNGLYLLCCIPLHPDSMIYMAGVTPLIEAISLLSYESISWLYVNPDRAQETEALLTCLVGVLVYGAAAIVLTTHAIISFDAKVDRPRRGWDQSDEFPGAKAEGVDEGQSTPSTAR